MVTIQHSRLKAVESSLKTPRGPLSPYWLDNGTGSPAAEKSGEPISAAFTTTYGYDYFDNRMFVQTATSTTYHPFTNFATSTTGTTTKYVMANGEMVARIVSTSTSQTAPTIFFVHNDHLGSANVLSGINGVMAEVISSYPFGETRIDDKVTANTPRKFVGMERDDTGLDYAQARYYDNARGQFLSQDPVHLAIGNPSQIQQLTKLQQDAILSDPQLLNSYSWASNNPIIKKDPEGKLAVLALFAIGALTNVALQGFEDLSTGAPIQWQNYVGAAIGGAAGTAAFLSTGSNPFAVGAVSQGTEEYASQWLSAFSSQESKSINYGSVVFQTGAGGVFGKVGFPGLKGVTAGRNSMQAITNQIGTKLTNGTIQNFTPGTASKILTTQFITGLPQAGFNSVQSSAISSLAGSFGFSSLTSTQVSAIQGVQAAFSNNKK